MQDYANIIIRQNAAARDQSMIRDAAFGLMTMDQVETETSISTNRSFLSMINGITGQSTKHLDEAKDASRRAWS
jgi:hypothetical protein